MKTRLAITWLALVAMVFLGLLIKAGGWAVVIFFGAVIVAALTAAAIVEVMS